MLLPAPIEGSGGLRTIFHYADGLHRCGHQVEMIVLDRVDWSEQTMSELAAEWYGIAGLTVRKAQPAAPDAYDAILATRWDSAHIAKAANAAFRGYIVQDAEFLFNPMGDAFIDGENSYLLGLQSFALGRWLSNLLAHRFGNRPHSMNFSAQLDTYRPGPWSARRRAVCFIHDPGKTRRCPKLGLQALALVKQRMPDVEIYLYGSRSAPEAGFDCCHLGILSPPQLAELYAYCQVGLCLSTSNPSRIPFEMMAAGLPVVDLYRQNNIFDMPDSAALLAFQEPEAIAAAVCCLLSDEKRAGEMSLAGPAFMQGRESATEIEQFVSAFAAWTRGDAHSPTVFQPLYRRDPGALGQARAFLLDAWYGEFGPEDGLRTLCAGKSR
jgi:hypothetical protein